MSYIGDLVDVLKEKDLTAEYVKSKITMANLKGNKEGTNQELKTSAFVNEKKYSTGKQETKVSQELTCFVCGKPEGTVIRLEQTDFLGD